MKAFTLRKAKSVINIPCESAPYNLISVFKTDVSSKRDADLIIKSLKQRFPEGKFNFDLDDMDSVFRMEYKRDIISEVINIFKGKRFTCETLV